MDAREMIGEREEGLRSIIEAFLLETWTCLPGIIQSFDPNTMTCVVQPSVSMQTLEVNLSPVPGEDQTTQVPITLHPVQTVPLVFIGGGGLVLETYPQQNDECLLIFSSRCIDGWWAKGGVQIQPQFRRHSLSDGFAIVGPRSQANLFSSLGPGMRLRTIDGEAYIELTPAKVVNIVAPGGINITGDVVITGSVSASEEGTFGVDAVPVSTHKHGGVTVGGGDTGVPIP